MGEKKKSAVLCRLAKWFISPHAVMAPVEIAWEPLSFPRLGASPGCEVGKVRTPGHTSSLLLLTSLR